MKKTIILICLFALFSCEKYPFLPDKYSESIIGDWIWVWTACWNSGYFHESDATDPTLQITFDHKGRYYEYKNDTLILSSKFSLDQLDNNLGFRTYKLTIENTKDQFRVLLLTDTLTIMPYNLIDACETFYVKQK